MAFAERKLYKLYKFVPCLSAKSCNGQNSLCSAFFPELVSRRKVWTRSQKTNGPPIVGARDIARYLFGDNGRESSIYEAGLPLFKIGGRVAAFREDLNRTVLAREWAELEACEQRQKVLSERIAIKTAKEQAALRACEQRRQVLAERIAAKTQGANLTEVAEGHK